MKKILFVSIFLAIYQGSFAQTTPKLDANQVIEQLLNTKLFIDYSNSKKGIETQLLALNNLPNISTDDYTALQTAYGKTKAAFDNFLGLIRQDMVDYQLFEKAANGDQTTLTRYLTAFNGGVAVYDNEFQPVYNRVIKTRSLKGWLEPLALQAFNVLGGFLKGKNARQNLLVNDLLLASKKYFISRMEMKPWEALVQIQPNATGTSVAPTTTDPNPTPSTIPSTMPVESPATSSDTIVDQPVMKTLSGSLEFVIAGNPPQNMSFASQTRSLKRNLVVGENNATTTSTGAINIPVFQTANAYGEGTAFQIRVQNTALLYAFVLNSDGKCTAIYPFNQNWVRSFQMSKSRDLSVGPLMLQDASGSTTIPARNANTGAENYIKISGPASKEQICLIVSKSEMDLNDVIAKIEQLTGSLAERVTALWQSEEHCANTTDAGLIVSGGSIQFNVQNDAKWLLPLVFEIKR